MPREAFRAKVERVEALATLDEIALLGFLGKAASPLVPRGRVSLSLVASDDINFAMWALSALADSRFRNDVRERARIAAERRGDARVAKAYVDAFESPERSQPLARP